MAKVILHGADAIHYAENHGVAVFVGDPQDPQHSATAELDEARAIAEREPQRVWVEIERLVNTGGDNTGPWDG